MNIILTVLSVGLFSALFVFRKNHAFVTKKPVAADFEPNLLIKNTDDRKVIEIDQKTDGAVTMYFQGKEFKISKPELDSESDQFISRLMELVLPGVKEIDYDIQSDEKMKVSAPLSKLVTRLGFVGIKRDLFFPRTSKTKVLFRKYITEQDLVSMKLSENQILNEFLEFN